MERFSPHNHTDMSNFRLIDCINKLEDLVARGVEIGLKGLAVTDHESLSQSIKVCQLQEKYPDFKIAIGNEIYLTDTRERSQKYYHFILIAKDAIGHKQLRELSSYSWMNSYFDRGLERVPTLKSELRDIVKKDPGHLIATSACLGGELSSLIIELSDARKVGNKDGEVIAYNKIDEFMRFVDDLFGDDFYVECAPGASSDQIIANKYLAKIAQVYNKKLVIGDDAHYLKKEDRMIHKAFLNSKDGEREVDAFYQYAYLQSEEDILENLEPSIAHLYETMCENSMEMFYKIQRYDLRHNQTIPKVEVPGTVKYFDQSLDKYPILQGLRNSNDQIERYWVNQCLGKLKELNKDNDTYLTELEEEARVKKVIGEKLDTNIFAYPITLQHYIDMMWDCGSIIGAGRGSSCAALNHYLLGITQLDPIEWNLPFFRYLNADRAELPDVDLDLCPSKRPLIMKKIKAERGKKFNENIDDLSRNNLGATFVVTFKTETAKSAIQTACRGYRSEELPMGIETDEAIYLASLVPIERGFNWTIDEMINGDKDKGRKPVMTFVNEVKKFPGLLEIILGIEGLITNRGIHASGVIMFDEDPYEFGCFMKAPNGEIVTQYELHDAEAAGLTKYDFLLTSVQDMILQSIKFLQEDGLIEDYLSIREVYDKYLHPNVIDIDDLDVWKSIDENKVLACFQFDSDIGSQGIKKVQPIDINELANTNGLIRLMAPDGEENPIDKYVRYKKNRSFWEKEMDCYNLTERDKENFRKYLKSSNGIGISQEQLMRALMDEELCNFSLKDANAARKIIGKKQMSKIPELKAQIFESAFSPAVGQYLWDAIAKPQMGYSFSDIHALAYSFIGYQTAYIATKWSPIYWDTSVLVVNSGSLEDNSAEIDEEDIEQKEKNSDYAKIAKALGEIIGHNIKVSLVDINKSDFGFKPDVENNQILFGLKALSGVNTEMIEKIKAGRPYANIKDFMARCPLGKKPMISLIKGGAFDNIVADFGIDSSNPYAARYTNMAYYLSVVSEPKKKLNLQNLNGLIQQGLIPTELNFETLTYLFNKEVRKKKFIDKETQVEYIKLDSDKLLEFYNKYFDDTVIETLDGTTPVIKLKVWDKQYQCVMDVVREWLTAHQKETLDKYNYVLFKEMADKYAAGNISSWEMEALCFYHSPHELIDVNKEKYGIVNFFDYPEEPIVDKYWKRNGKEIPIFKLYKIAGTVISKNDARHSISLLTTEGVVPVKFNREQYALYKRQLSEVQEDGKKKVVEKGYFVRGTKLLLTGFRRDDQFVVKRYASTPGHSVYKITEVFENGDITIENTRGKQE